MKIYMCFDSAQGAGDGACLVFANNAREAKKLAYPVVSCWFGSEWVTTGVTLLKDRDYLEALAKSDLPHVIECPETCTICGLWGTGEIIDNVCRECNDIGLGGEEYD